ncbi:BZ3500_MvSof-1268-A1-R1_Chr9g10803 [Microbotryum saponariae]|uniref:BZ3500_MvSof-1268-A1-R1_Chr9g10803 protein n=1 Tax=Microbotryum saponariae TaxID=289078 RepID=A0A2X0MEP6_9BASI|nr:BZ3501_MvSof-1269-A2-R1_Chr9g10551 [Microbotryum saponariae]SDA00721.1 BZ3500_MvSof-1268-A1-R1_Chr9g10803 [Microbotryum saponariae]
MAPWKAPSSQTSEASPLTQSGMLAEVLQDTGQPAGVLRVVHVCPKDAPGVAEATMADWRFQKINGKHLKPIVFRVGGKPASVTAEADLAHAVFDELTSLLKAKTDTLSAPSDALLRGVFSTLSATRVNSSSMLRFKATVAAGQPKIEGNYYSVIDSCRSDHSEKLFLLGFGVGSPLIVSNITSEPGNDRKEGSAPVFSLLRYRDGGVVLRKRSLLALPQHIQGATIHKSAQMPPGGWELGGYGRFNGIDGIQECTQTSGHKQTTSSLSHLEQACSAFAS